MPTPTAAPAPVEHRYQVGNLYVVERSCRWAADRRHGEVVVQSANPDFPRAIEELQGTDARNLASAYAATQGMADARINGNVVGPYPINSDGVALDAVKNPDGSDEPLPPQHPKMQVAGYRCDVKVCGRLF